MPRLVISLEIHNLDPALSDPHEVVEALFGTDLPTFSPGTRVLLTAAPYEPAADVWVTFEAAEWTP